MWRLGLLPALALALPSGLLAQSSQFSVRGLGLPGRGLAVRSGSLGGGFGLFDAESSLNPASLTSIRTLTSSFTATQEWRTSTNPAGEASLRDSRFPLVRVVGPIPSIGVWLGGSVTMYTNRDFRIASVDTIALRGQPVGVADTTSSIGGMSDVSIAGAITLDDVWSVGLGLHVLTGVSRVEARRTFADSSFLPFRQSAELSTTGWGVSAGLVGRLSSTFMVALTARSDAKADVDRDSTATGEIDLPHRFGAGMLWQVHPKLTVAGHAQYHTWSAANSDLLAQGGVGAKNTWEVAVGAEWVGDPDRPFRRPLRLGVHYTQLPFPLAPGQQGREVGVSVGTGARFAGGRGGIDLGLERLWRREGPNFSESAWLLSLGVSIRP